ncbi:MAG: hypothetical protein AAGA30_16925, partial [Planctomycetota bacterium]
MNPPSTKNSLLFSIIAVACCCFSGCYPELQTGYGKARGTNYAGSVNGTVVFHEMIEAAGYEVDRYRKYSPRWNKYDTVFWAPDTFTAPSEEAMEKIEAWLAAKPYQTLVWIARDFDASIAYWEALIEKESVTAKKSELERKHIDAITTHLYQKNLYPMQKCRWYDYQNHPLSSARSVGGNFVEEISGETPEIRYSSLPKPGTVQSNGKFGDYEVEVLMTVDSHPFIYALTSRKFRN